MKAIIKARKLWNRTGIEVVAGQTYSLSAHGIWVDCYIQHGPEGDPSPNTYMRLFERLRRVSDQNWFTLIGAVNENIGTAFAIGKNRTLPMNYSGELTCFANDVRGFYWNNLGSVLLDVTPV